MNFTSSNPLVSILIPCWGCREYIADTIRSAVSQTYHPFEVVVVEDCGSDGTYEEALKFHDQRLRVFRNLVNKGQHGNKNHALGLAHGQLIKYLDGDDLLEPHCVSTLVQCLKLGGSGVGIVFGRRYNIDKVGRRLGVSRRWGVAGRFNGMSVLDAISRKKEGSSFGNVSPHLLVREYLEKVNGFPQDNSDSGDMETFLKISAISDAYFTETIVAKYRSTPGGMGSRNFGLRMATDSMRSIEKLSEFLAELPQVPVHLNDERFLRDWKVSAACHAILPSYQRKLRGLSNQYAQIEEFYRSVGLGPDLAGFVRKNFAGFIVRTIMTKIRSFLGLPQHPPLFGKSDVDKLASSFQSCSDL